MERMKNSRRTFQRKVDGKPWSASFSTGWKTMYRHWGRTEAKEWKRRFLTGHSSASGKQKGRKEKLFTNVFPVQLQNTGFFMTCDPTETIFQQGLFRGGKACHDFFVHFFYDT